MADRAADAIAATLITAKSKRREARAAAQGLSLVGRPVGDEHQRGHDRALAQAPIKVCTRERTAVSPGCVDGGGQA